MKKNNKGLIHKIIDFFQKIIGFKKKEKENNDIYPMW